MATSNPIPRRHPTATANHGIFYELAERSPLLTPYTGENPVVLSCIATMRKVTHIVGGHMHAFRSLNM